MCEQWKPVIGYEGFYEVSNLGRVLSLPRNTVPWVDESEKHRRGKLLSVSRNTVCLCKNNIREVLALKDIVLQAFVDSSIKHFNVDYIDGDKSNCSLHNLKIKDVSSYSNEVWKDIEGYEKYQISNYGRIRIKSHCQTYIRSDTGKECVRQYGYKIMKLSESTSGYYQIDLCIDNTVSTRLVHRLVAQAFIPNPDKLPWVNHKDLNKKNNYYTNLEWTTEKENVNHAIETGAFRYPEKGKRRPPRPLYCIELDATFKNIKEAAEAIGSSYQYLIDRMKAGLPCHGYTFKDIDENR